MPDPTDETSPLHDGLPDPLFQQAPEALLLVDAGGGRVLAANAAAADLYGCTRDELARLTALDLSAGRAPGQWPDAAGGPGEVAGGGPYRHRRADGTEFPAEVSARPVTWLGAPAVLHAVRDASGLLAGRLDTRTASARLRRAADAQRESEDRHRALFEHLPHGVIYTDAQGRILAANPAAERFFGLSAAVLIGRSMDDPRWKIVHNDGTDFPAGERAVMTALRTGRAVDAVELGVYNEQAGAYRWARVTAVPEIRPGETEPHGVLATFDDVTQRHRWEKDLRESEARYRAMFAENRAIKLLIDPATGEIVDANPAAVDFYGYTYEQLRAMLISDINTLSVPEVKAEMDTAAGSPTANFAFRHRLASGEVRDVEVNSGPLVVDGRKLLFSIIQDVTERRLAEEQVRRNAEQLRRALEGTVLAVSQVTESRDPYTAGHERRVSELVVAIAEQLGWPEHAVEGLRIAAILHDIGKVSVPVEILSRPGRLGAAEFELIKQHAQEGHDILAGISFEWPVAEMVLQHHERLDGSGYPRGITADQILPEARILAVADVVEAMSSHRPYRPSLGIAAALEEVRRGAGTLFDADVVTACEEVCAAGFAFGD